jgi:predicted RNA binding protein YcfA (HicA-like mRNA interferase family)
VSFWPSKKAKHVLAALLRIGWIWPEGKGSGSSHIKLKHKNNKYPPFTWSFHDGEEIGPRMLARIAKHTGLTPFDF